jgi:hypothetical protein
MLKLEAKGSALWEAKGITILEAPGSTRWEPEGVPFEKPEIMVS